MHLVVESCKGCLQLPYAGNGSCLHVEEQEGESTDGKGVNHQQTI